MLSKAQWNKTRSHTCEVAEGVCHNSILLSNGTIRGIEREGE